MGTLDYIQIVFLVLVMVGGIGGFLWATAKDDDV